MKILIVGAGIGGLTLAAFLENSDIEYEIVEKVADWKHQGYSLGLWNNGRHILNKLGLSDSLDRQGARIQNYFIRNGKGKLLRTYNLQHFYSTYGMGLTMISRAGVHDGLLSKVDPAKIQMNMSVEKIEQLDSKTSVTFTDGHVKEYDLVVGADGIHSKVRNIAFEKDVVTINKWRVWYMWLDNSHKTKAAVTEYLEPGEFISIFDSGVKTFALITASSGNTIWDDPKGRIERLKHLFKDVTSVVPKMFDMLTPEDINPADLIHIETKNWVKGNVVLLGDSAHGFEPYAGIGASMALEDGYVLASQLMQVSETYSLAEALQNYEKKRKGRVGLAMKLTQKMKGWVVIKSKFWRGVVNFILPFFPAWYLTKDYHKLMKEEI